jgi:lipopolysaccharide export system permease protein
MSILYRMLIRQFLPLFLLAIVFFVLLLQLIDVFGSIWRYFAHNVGLGQIGWIALLSVPK